MPQFTAEEVKMINDSLQTEITKELNSSRIDHAKVGKITGIIHKIQVEANNRPKVVEKIA